MADIRAMQLYGGEPFAKGLAKVAFNDAVFAGIVQGKVVPSLLKEDKVVSNLASIMRLVTNDLSVEQRAKIVAPEAAEAGDYDSHPTISTRLTYAARFVSGEAEIDAREVSALFREWSSVNETLAALYNQRLFAYLRSLQAAQGQSAQVPSPANSR